jgi:hypothetical protein
MLHKEDDLIISNLKNGNTCFIGQFLRNIFTGKTNVQHIACHLPLEKSFKKIHTMTDLPFSCSNDEFQSMLGGVDGSLLSPLPSTIRFNQNEPATFSILQCWAFFQDSFSSMLNAPCVN